ncbi:MAG TPA: hypothetical protein VHI96_01835 [Solirubrobacterales bacterium]|nr:hypothetical protein [Solirubrobacterales bacterium]
MLQTISPIPANAVIGSTLSRPVRAPIPALRSSNVRGLAIVGIGCRFI